MIAQLMRNAATRAAIYYAASGAMFVVGTLILARALDAESFGRLAIAIALMNLGMFGGTAGLSGIWLRHELRADRHMLTAAVMSILTAAGLLTAVGMIVYGLDLLLGALVFAAISCGGLALLGLVPLQKARRFDLAVPLSQSANLVIFLAAVLILGVPALRLSWLPLAGVAVVSAVVAWFAWQHSARGSATIAASFRSGMWPDVLRFMSVAVAAELLIQLERLVIPLRLDIEVLRSFVVLAAVAIAPFSTLEKAVNATLIPRLQKADGPIARRRVLRDELVVLCGLSFTGAALLVWLGPYVIAWFLNPAPEISRAAILAAVGSGTARTLAAVPRAVAGAFCSREELQALNRRAWIATACAAVAGASLAGFGLVGVVLGVASGWALRGAAAYAIARGHLSFATVTEEPIP